MKSQLTYVSVMELGNCIRYNGGSANVALGGRISFVIRGFLLYRVEFYRGSTIPYFWAQ